MNTSEISIGGQLIRVPAGYVTAEAEYTKVELFAFHNAPHGSTRAGTRQAVLAKRIEFHELYLAGKAIITPPAPKPSKTRFQKICYWLIGGKV